MQRQRQRVSLSLSASIHHDSLRVLEWDKLCDLVASFACTSLGRQALKDQLWSLNQTFEESLALLEETNAAVEMNKHGSLRLHLGHLDAMLVKTAIQQARRSIPVSGYEAWAIVALLQCAETLPGDLKAAIKEDKDWHNRFMPLTEVIMEFVINRSLIKAIEQVVDEDGSIKDSAVGIEFLFLMMVFIGSGSGVGSTIEPLSAVPLNDELQRARSLVVKAEADVLLTLTKKMQLDLEDIENTLNSLVELDVINARATYGLSFGWSSPHIFLPDRGSSSTAEAFLPRKENPYGPLPSKREWMLYLLKAYPPLLLQRHKEKLRKAKKDVNIATSNAALDNAQPVPVDFSVSQKTRVIVITGPNTGSKTICLKTVGLAAMMAKSGLYVLASESAQIPWFDFVFADIGDEQSLSQSLSTFSGHLKQISVGNNVGGGTNPLEGAALGMALLKSFARHFDEAFENACMEFDEVNLKPTYKFLWGVPDWTKPADGPVSGLTSPVQFLLAKLIQDYQDLLDEARHYLRGLHNSLLNTRRKIMEYSTNLRFKKMRDVSEAAVMAGSVLHKKVRELDASAKQPSQINKTISSSNLSATNKSLTVAENKKPTIADKSASSVKAFNQSRSDKSGPPKVGDMVHVSSLGKKFQKLKFLDFSGFVKNYSFAMSSAIQMVGVLIVQGLLTLLEVEYPCTLFKNILTNSYNVHEFL
ncbi:hypothetical protein JHK87_040522 [Glycine soja]|nr:hypothetical protein JHK87_040522 [Glycine soja]